MSQFFNLFVQSSRRPQSWKDPGWADREFPAIMADSPFRIWKPGDPIAAGGTWLLLGVATWSGYDMRLLDVIAAAVLHRSSELPIVEVFNTDKCRHPREFKQYIATLRHPCQTPFVGIWRDGRLEWSGEGFEARDRVAQLFHSGSAEIVAFVQDRINFQAPAGGR